VTVAEFCSTSLLLSQLKQEMYPYRSISYVCSSQLKERGKILFVDTTE
jgi:hypothetical protein